MGNPSVFIFRLITLASVDTMKIILMVGARFQLGIKIKNMHFKVLRRLVVWYAYYRHVYVLNA